MKRVDRQSSLRMAPALLAALFVALLPGAASATERYELHSLATIWIATLLLAFGALALGWAQRWLVLVPLALAAILYKLAIDPVLLDLSEAARIRAEIGRVYFISLYASLPIVALAALIGFWLGTRRQRRKAQRGR